MANALIINLTNATSVQDFVDLDIQYSFQPITSAAELDDEVARGALMDKANESVAAMGTKLVYLDIARIVHLAQQVANGSDAFKEAFNHACSAKGIVASKDAKANPFARHAHLLMGRADNNGAYLMDGKWKNNLRAVRWLVENKVRPQDVPAEIAKAKVTDSNGNVVFTRLLALNELDKKAHKPTKSKKPSRFGSVDAERAIKGYSDVATLNKPIALKFNAEGFALAVVRKGANGNGEVMYDSGLKETFVMKAVRDGYKAVK